MAGANDQNPVKRCKNISILVWAVNDTTSGIGEAVGADPYQMILKVVLPYQTCYKQCEDENIQNYSGIFLQLLLRKVQFTSLSVELLHTSSMNIQKTDMLTNFTCTNFVCLRYSKFFWDTRRIWWSRPANNVCVKRTQNFH